VDKNDNNVRHRNADALEPSKVAATPMEGDESPANPRAAGRRRLLRTLGGAGSVAAVTALLAPNWVRPVVQVVVLPAHAQLSGISLTCNVIHIYELMWGGVGILSITASYANSSTTYVLNTTFDTATTGTTTFSTVMPTGPGNIGYIASSPAGTALVTLRDTVSCCVNSTTQSTSLLFGGGVGLYTDLNVASDGTCTVTVV